MTKYKIGFLDEKEGERSSMRLMCLLSLLVGAGLACFAIGTKQLDVNVIGIVTLFVIGAFAPKAIQKYAEKTE